jgi:hypothetical protein
MVAALPVKALAIVDDRTEISNCAPLESNAISANFSGANK